MADAIVGADVSRKQRRQNSTGGSGQGHGMPLLVRAIDSFYACQGVRACDTIA